MENSRGRGRDGKGQNEFCKDGTCRHPQEDGCSGGGSGEWTAGTVGYFGLHLMGARGTAAAVHTHTEQALSDSRGGRSKAAACAPPPGAIKALSPAVLATERPFARRSQAKISLGCWPGYGPSDLPLSYRWFLHLLGQMQVQGLQMHQLQEELLLLLPGRM
ncbi:hypothetical protein HispidOSU_005425 [Sigmodon hispidus]